MKKTMTLIIAAAMGMSVLAGCQGSTSESSSAGVSESSSSSTSESTSESSSSSSTASSSSEEEQLDYIEGDFTYDECVELPKYKGLKLEKEVTEVTDSMVKAQYTTLMSDELEEVTDSNAKIEAGDTVTMDYECKVGDADEYGDPQGTDYSVIIGSKQTIDGFEDGLIGHKNGEEVYLDLKFPDEYYDEYAGKDVTFHITIKKIERANPTDEWVNEYTEGEYTTVKDYDKYLKESLEESYQASAESTLLQTAWQEVYNAAKFKALPKEYVDEGKANVESQVQSMMDTYGIESIDDFLEQSGMSQEDYDKELKTSGETSAKTKLLVNAIWDKEKLSEDDDLYKEALQELVDSGSSTEDELIETYGEDKVKDYCKSMAVCNFIVKNADVTEVKA